MIKITEEYLDAAKLFKRTFNYGVPLCMLPRDIDTEELIRNIMLCIDRNEDTLLSIYGVNIGRDELV